MRYKMRDWVHAYVRAILAVSVLLEEFAVAEQGTAIAVVIIDFFLQFSTS